MIFADHKLCRVCSSIGTWARAYPTTDRIRSPIPLASLDTFHLYFIQLAESFKPLRTLDKDSDKGITHTSWSDFFFTQASPEEPEEEDPTHNPTQEFEIEAIIDHRPTAKGGQFEYKVVWSEYDEELYATWEDRESLEGREELKEYEEHVMNSPDTNLDLDTLGDVPHNPSSQEKLRGLALRGLRDQAVYQGTKDIVYAVIADGLFTGVHRAAKTAMKGMCPFCLRLDHKETPESTRHLAWECPYAKLVWDGTIRAAHLSTSSDNALIEA